MKIECFNCASNIADGQPICPICFAVQKKRFTREEVIDFLEAKYPTKPRTKSKFESTQKPLKQRSHGDWLVFGLATFGLGYYYYLLVTLKDLSDHWFYPHGPYENATKVDLFISSLIVMFTFFLGAPFIQYMRYEKLRRHLQKSPDREKRKLPLQGKYIALWYIALNVLFGGTFTMIITGILSVVIDMVTIIEFHSTAIMSIFFTGAGLVFLLMILVGVLIQIFERRWQTTYNSHILWHQRNLRQEKKSNMKISS
ncbi:MAG: hypothetical protein KGD59_12240 [Candidatus Heimdallarchaeota archaeon]|nr:hypothetical protein [Candidatus Heimdallarchaeota archaeon]MBY8995313.1 hypothetical protein [Candidatus Heimdallarchaeota archaeon]